MMVHSSSIGADNMVNIIICDDNNDYRKEIIRVVEKVFQNNLYDFKIHAFSDYDESFLKVIEAKLENKVYILDMETPSSDGIQISRLIRKNDLNSFITYITLYYDKYKLLLDDDAMFLGYIDKREDYKHELEQILLKMIRLRFRKQMLRVKCSGIITDIDMRHIDYISCNRASHSIEIHTNWGVHTTNLTLNEAMDLLDDRFVYAHRKYIVNREHISNIDVTRKIITLSNSIKLEASDTFLKNFKNTEDNIEIGELIETRI